MSQAPQPLSIAQCLASPVGTPVPVIVGVLVDVEQWRDKIGKRKDSTVQSATLKDANGDEIRLNIWNHPDYFSRKGASVRIMAAKDDKGKWSTEVIQNSYTTPPSIELQLKKTTALLISGADIPPPATAPADPPKQTPPESTPPPSEGQKSDGGERTLPPATQVAANRPRPINGQTVGNSMKLALEAVMFEWKAPQSEPNDEYTWSDFVRSREFATQIHERASDFIRISLRLERGMLADSPKEREDAEKRKEEAERLAAEAAANPPPPTQPPAVVTPPQKAKAGPGGEAFDPGDNVDEDVPF